MSMCNCFGSSSKDHSSGNKLQKHASLKRRKQPTTTNPIADRTGPIDRDYDENQEDFDYSYLTTRDFDALTLGLNSNDEWEWSGGHRLSAILEILSEKSRRDSGSVQDILERYMPPGERLDLSTLNREYERLSRHLRNRTNYSMSASRSPERQERRSPPAPRAIEAPPRNVSSTNV